MSTDGLMKGKRGLIMGVANDRSIAWGIAEALHKAGAELAFTYQGDTFKKRVAPAGGAAEPGRPDRLRRLQPGLDRRRLRRAERDLGPIDFLVHAIAFSDKEQLKGRYVDTTPENFRMTMDISCYSFTAVANRAEKMMTNGGGDGDADLLRRREGDAALQCDGRGQGGAGSQRALSGRRPRQEERSRSMRCPPGRSRRWRPAASAISATC